MGLTGVTYLSVLDGYVDYNGKGCAVIENDKVKCWGNGEDGQLGNGQTGNSIIPVEVLNLTGVNMVSVGWKHSCALKNDGTVWCWGSGEYGQLGNGENINNPIPVQVKNLKNIIFIASYHMNTCALKNDGTIWCWGSYELLGDGKNYYPELWSNVPVKVLDIDNAISISLSKNHACALLDDETVKCWGNNYDYQLGRKDIDYYSNVPILVLKLNNVKKIFTTDRKTCALLNNDIIKCWGLIEVKQNYSYEYFWIQEPTTVYVPMTYGNTYSAIATGIYTKENKNEKEEIPTVLISPKNYRYNGYFTASIIASDNADGICYTFNGDIPNFNINSSNCSYNKIVNINNINNYSTFTGLIVLKARSFIDKGDNNFVYSDIDTQIYEAIPPNVELNPVFYDYKDDENINVSVYAINSDGICYTTNGTDPRLSSNCYYGTYSLIILNSSYASNTGLILLNVVGFDEYSQNKNKVFSNVIKGIYTKYINNNNQYKNIINETETKLINNNIGGSAMINNIIKNKIINNNNKNNDIIKNLTNNSTFNNEANKESLLKIIEIKDLIDYFSDYDCGNIPPINPEIIDSSTKIYRVGKEKFKAFDFKMTTLNIDGINKNNVNNFDIYKIDLMYTYTGRCIPMWDIIDKNSIINNDDNILFFVRTPTLIAIMDKKEYNHEDTKDHWARFYTEHFFKNNIINKSNIFNPDLPITKAEFIKLLLSKFDNMNIKVKNNELISKENNNIILDNYKNHWAFEYLKKAYDIGLLKIFNNFQNEFLNIDDYVQRYEVPYILAKYMKWDGEYNNMFKLIDTYIDKLSEKVYVNLILKLNLMRGRRIFLNEERKFDPLDNLTRAEALKVIYRFYSILKY